MPAYRPWALLTLSLLATAACGDEGEETCFLPETLVLTPDGPVPIGALKAGDAVYAYDHASSERVVRRVAAIHRAQVQTVCAVEVGDGGFGGITPSHPVYDVTSEAYVPLRDLRPDARLLTADGRVVSPSGLTIDERAEPTIEVVNLTVDGPEHNYFADGLLVHNKQCDHCICGDGIREVGNDEQCDDGNNDNGDGCDANCQLEGQGGSGGN